MTTNDLNNKQAAYQDIVDKSKQILGIIVENIQPMILQIKELHPQSNIGFYTTMYQDEDLAGPNHFFGFIYADKNTYWSHTEPFDEHKTHLDVLIEQVTNDPTFMAQEDSAQKLEKIKEIMQQVCFFVEHLGKIPFNIPLGVSITPEKVETKILTEQIQ